MSDIIKSKNIVSIKEKKTDRLTDEQGQGCVKCPPGGVKNRTTLYIVKSEHKKNIWHPKCFNLHYGKAIKPEGKALKLLHEFVKHKEEE